jgi:hypothetical protein
MYPATPPAAAPVNASVPVITHLRVASAIPAFLALLPLADQRRLKRATGNGRRWATTITAASPTRLPA